MAAATLTAAEITFDTERPVTVGEMAALDRYLQAVERGDVYRSYGCCLKMLAHRAPRRDLVRLTLAECVKATERYIAALGIAAARDGMGGVPGVPTPEFGKRKITV